MSRNRGHLVRAVLALLAGLLLSDCGAESALVVQHFPPDAAVWDVVTMDVPVDVPIDHADACCLPEVTCDYEAINTIVDRPVYILSGAATCGFVASHLWRVVSSPPGSTPIVTNPNLYATTFSANEAGIYTLQFTLTQSNGCAGSCTLSVTVAPT